MAKTVQNPYVPGSIILGVTDCEKDREMLNKWVDKACREMSIVHIVATPRDRDCADLNRDKVRELLEVLVAHSYQLGRDWEKAVTQGCLV